jgi:alpha-aminoadipic semialdehyde synthase
MIDTLWALGRRFHHEGIDNPFRALRPAHTYDDLAHAKREVAAVGERIAADGLPDAMLPFVCGFAGYGQVSCGAQEIFDLLPVQEVPPADLEDLPDNPRVCYKVVFKEEHLVRRIDDAQPFELNEYYTQPQRYEAAFFPHVEHLTALVNCIYWEPRYPKLIDQAQFRALYADGQPKLRVIGDISCDINGSLACTTHATDPGSPIYVYNPTTRVTAAGETGPGPVVLAVDFLPCEVPVDASRSFSTALRPYLAALAAADFSGPLEQSGLPPELARAVIVYRGELTESFSYLREFVS